MKRQLASSRVFSTGRSHYCEWNGERSEPTPLFNYSCIQGSSAGAIIYNLYTRDLNNVTDDELVGFADDVNIVSSNDGSPVFWQSVFWQLVILAISVLAISIPAISILAIALLTISIWAIALSAISICAIGRSAISILAINEFWQ